jgi:hypothetical protein
VTPATCRGRNWRLKILAASAALTAGSGAAWAQDASCAAFEGIEADGRAQLDRRIAEVDEAAGRGDTADFCRASADLVFVYRSLGAAGRGCSPERAAKWEKAEAETTAALARVCP